MKVEMIPIPGSVGLVLTCYAEILAHDYSEIFTPESADEQKICAQKARNPTTLLRPSAISLRKEMIIGTRKAATIAITATNGMTPPINQHRRSRASRSRELHYGT